MRIIIDANRVISALLRAGSTRRALLDSQSELCAPFDLENELVRHRTELLRRSAMTPDAYDDLLSLLLRRIRWVPQAEVERHLSLAMVAIGATDPADAPFLAAALAVGADAIWSEDKHFDVQSLVPRTRHPDRIER